MLMKIRILTCVAVAIAMFVLASRSQADSIVWAAPQPISGDTDVSTAGMLDRAFVFGNSATITASTVNGVTFAPFGGDGTQPSISSGNTTIASNGFVGGNSTALGSAASPFAALSANYRSLLQGAVYSNGLSPGFTGTLTVTLNGLAVGTPYQFETWVNDSRAGNFRTQTVAAGNAATMVFNSTHLEGGVGQYLTGTFTATGTSQVVTFAGTGVSDPFGDPIGQINAFELRALPAPVPLPSTLVVGLAGFAGLAAWTFRRKQAA